MDFFRPNAATTASWRRRLAVRDPGDRHESRGPRDFTCCWHHARNHDVSGDDHRDRFSHGRR